MFNRALFTNSAAVMRLTGTSKKIGIMSKSKGGRQMVFGPWDKWITSLTLNIPSAVFYKSVTDQAARQLLYLINFFIAIWIFI